MSWRDMGSPLAGGEPRGLILLDMVGERDVRIPMERLSLVRAPAWTREVFDRAQRLGLGGRRVRIGHRHVGHPVRGDVLELGTGELVHPGDVGIGDLDSQIDV